PAKTAIDKFTARNDSDSPQSRNMEITPYNSATGCYGMPKNFMITVNPKPLANVTNVNICNGKDLFIKLDAGAGTQAATGYKWQQSGDADDDIGLANSADWTAEIPLFTPPPEAGARVLTRSMVITPYNSLTACIGDPKPWSITVNPVPAISADKDLSKLCAGTLYKEAFTVSLPAPISGGSWAVYNKNTSDPNGISTAASNSAAEGKGDL
ncbi:MAG: hypothetical protein CRN43_20335, partial [Candidatus Nephrothrix sp. EaCA]